MILKLEILIFGHILNPLWHSREKRRKKRGYVTQRAVTRHLKSYTNFIRNLTPQEENATDENERLFSIWLQGEEAAPEAVKACWRSIRTNCSKELVILDAETIKQWITLPEYITKKWEQGKIKPAHYADICRLALLVKYGGIWLDATDYVENDFPKWLWDKDFFIYMSGAEIFSYTFVQNCFIRSKRNNFLAYAWLQLIYEYWRRESKPIEYFIHQLLFKVLVENNTIAAEMFRSMPKIDQDNTHKLWYTYGHLPYDKNTWKEVTSSALFQKIEYKSKMAKSPEKGTFAYHLINSCNR